MKSLRALYRLLGIVAVGIGMTLLQGLVVGPILRNRTKLAQWVHKGVAKFMNIDVVIRGKPNPKQQALIISNHMSEFDASVIGTVFRGAFIGKREIAKWPVIGFLVKQYDFIGVKRARKKDGQEAYAEAQAHAHYKVTNAVNQGKSIVFFGEATTTNGQTVIPFRAGMLRILFDGAVDRDGNALKVTADVKVQPVAIRVLNVNGRDATNDQYLRDYYAWYGNSESMLAHVWKKAARANRIVVELTILPALDAKDFATPEDLANAAHKLVADVVDPGWDTRISAPAASPAPASAPQSPV
ncbi:MAG: hypothetical protein JWO78_351 [Micavibrio sp.]|nr:hypothetical protein [Micavibrio sp.]